MYETPALAGTFPIPIDQVRNALDATVARPVTPVYSELSELLQVRIHRALTRQEEPDDALRAAAREIRALFTRSGLDGSGTTPSAELKP